MSDAKRLQPAVDALLEELQALDEQRVDLVNAVNHLLRRMGKPELDVPGATAAVRDGQIRPDQFYGRPLATCVTELLELRGRAVQLDEIVDALQAGGHVIQGKYPKRTLGIAISKNRKFATIPNTDSVGLREWYPNLKPSKNGKEPEAAADTEVEAAEDNRAPAPERSESAE